MLLHFKELFVQLTLMFFRKKWQALDDYSESGSM